jgi:SpoVK/Ycf46/Vps4 family AAA+-type ATPase
MPDGVVKVTPRYGWQDLVIPGERMALLKGICVHARNRGEPGHLRGRLFSRKGLIALFTGLAGNGKTMAAEVIANDLGLDLYRIDLSRVVSTYIGETEKNLDRIFTVAEANNALLFFDEADALFGKRTEVKDSHDRYANIEINFLLQKLESYEGVAILATNHRESIDETFIRRMHVVIDFTEPDQVKR